MGYNVTTNTFDVLADLTGQVGTDGVSVSVRSGTTFNDGGGGIYFWDASSTATQDGVTIIQVTGVTTGRWMRSKNNNYSVGSYTFPVIALTSTYTITHNLPYTPRHINLQASTGAAAASPVYIPAASINATTFQIVFSGLLLVGTATFSYLAIR